MKEWQKIEVAETSTKTRIHSSRVRTAAHYRTGGLFGGVSVWGSLSVVSVRETPPTETPTPWTE